MTIRQDAANLDVLSGISSTTARKEESYSCSEPLPSTCLQLPTVVGCISLHERRGCSSASTPLTANGDSAGRHSCSDLFEPVTLSSLCQPVLQARFPLASPDRSSQTWKQNTTAVMVIEQRSVEGAKRTAAGSMVANINAPVDLPASTDFMCVLEV